MEKDIYKITLFDIETKYQSINEISVVLDDDSDAPGITMDFMISPEESDQILCVKFNLQSEVLGIAWES